MRGVSSSSTILEDFSWIVVGTVVWVREGTQQGIRGNRASDYAGKVSHVHKDGTVTVVPSVGMQFGCIERCEHLSEGSLSVNTLFESKMPRNFLVEECAICPSGH